MKKMKKENSLARNVLPYQRHQNFFNQNQEEDPIYYVMNEQYKIKRADEEFVELLQDLMQCSNKFMQEGDVLLCCGEGPKLWISSSKKSLIAVKENKKQPKYISRTYMGKNKPKTSEIPQYYILCEIPYVIPAEPEKNQMYHSFICLFSFICFF